MNFDLPKIETEKLRLDDFIIDGSNNNDIQLGKGSFADVYKAQHRIQNKLYAIKVVN